MISVVGWHLEIRQYNSIILGQLEKIVMLEDAHEDPSRGEIIYFLTLGLNNL